MSYFQMEYYKLKSENEKLKEEIRLLRGELGDIKHTQVLAESQSYKTEYELDMERVDTLDEVWPDYINIQTEGDNEYLVYYHYYDPWEGYEVYRYKIKSLGLLMVQGIRSTDECDEELAELLVKTYDEYIVGKNVEITWDDFLFLHEVVISEKWQYKLSLNSI